MVIDNISESEVNEAIRDGLRIRNNRGPGFLYNLGTITVNADSRPCHHFIITAYKKKQDQPSHKDKPYRRRRYLRRGKKGMKCPRCDKAQLNYGKQSLEISGDVTGTFKGYQCPNCLLTFYDEESSRKIRDLVGGLEIEPFTAEEISLILLAATDQPIRGAISFMKEAFLLTKEVLPRFRVPIIRPKFISYYYGPYSFDLIDAWNNIEEYGHIERTGRKSTNKESFDLTPKGRKKAESLIKRLPMDLRMMLPNWRRGMDELGNDGILKYVYIKYPRYTDKSKIRERVLPRGIRRRA
jgi:hypothetical protein